MDGNVHARRLTGLAATASVPGMATLCAVAYMSILQMPNHFELKLHHLELTDLELCMSAGSTCVAFLAFFAYKNRLIVLQWHKYGNRVPCGFVNASFVLEPVVNNTYKSKHGFSAVAIKPLPYKNQSSIRQLYVKKASKGVVDSRQTVAGSARSSDSKMNLGKRCCLYSLGLLSLGCMSSTLWRLDSIAQSDVNVSMLGLICSSGFCGYVALSFQRDLLKMLFFNFHCFFNSFNMSVLCLCAGDVFNWDHRAFAMMALWIWYHWTLCLDALTPNMRHKFGLTKPLTVFIRGLIILYLIWIGTNFFVRDLVKLNLKNRIVLEQEIFGKMFQVQVLDFVSGRLS